MPDLTLNQWGEMIAAWHERNWPGPGHPHLAVGKVGEEAGELFGALVKWVEGRPGITDQEARARVLDELGDVVIACAGALRRINDMFGTDHQLGDVLATRWLTVGARDYRQETA